MSSDITRPTIHGCVSMLNFTADHRSKSTTITWTPPTAIDNADPSPKVTQLYGPKIGDTLVGSAIVKYQAIDDSGNPSSVCVMILYVHGTSIVRDWQIICYLLSLLLTVGKK